MATSPDTSDAKAEPTPLPCDHTRNRTKIVATLGPATVDPAVLTAAKYRPGLLLVHELVHVRQWGELGVIRFLWRYLSGYLGGRWKGLGHHAAYLAIPLEVEARVAARLLE